MSESEFGRDMEMPDEASAEQVEVGKPKHYKVRLLVDGKLVRDCGVFAADPQAAVNEAKKQLETPTERIAALLAAQGPEQGQGTGSSVTGRVVRRDRSVRSVPTLVEQPYDIQVFEMQNETVGDDDGSIARQVTNEVHVLNQTYVKIGTWR